MSFSTRALVSCLIAIPLSAAIPAPVKTTGGMIAGVSGNDPSVTVFRGVPFAAPPVGDLRWRAPKPVVPWDGVRPGDRFGASCMQPVGPARDPWTPEYRIQGAVSEDCLFLNIWTAAKSASERRPVMVWIHGGAFVEGSGGVALYDGEQLARKGLVMVTINYRLGAFGFMAHPELTKESGHGSSGNYALLDMVAALDWVQKNIARFGGDPNRVTIAGQSAGAMAVHVLTASPLAKGLFHRAIAESGAVRDLPKLTDAEQAGVKFAEARGARSLAELRALPADQLMPGRFGPIVDGWLLTDNADAVFAAGKQNDVPVLTGSNADENGASPHPDVKLADFEQRARQRYGARAEEFLKLYPAANDEQAAVAQNESARDSSRFQMGLWAASRQKTSKTHAYTYYYDHPEPGPNRDRFGAFHSSEIPYVFVNLIGQDRAFGAGDRKIAEAMSSYWVNFAAKGDPNGSGLAAWPAFDSHAMITMRLGDGFGAMAIADRSRLVFLSVRP